jgi:hypothetical protein
MPNDDHRSDQGIGPAAPGGDDCRSMRRGAALCETFLEPGKGGRGCLRGCLLGVSSPPALRTQRLELWIAVLASLVSFLDNSVINVAGLPAV